MKAIVLAIALTLVTASAFAVEPLKTLITYQNSVQSELLSTEDGQQLFQCSGTCDRYINGVYVGSVTVTDSCVGNSVTCTILSNPCRVIAACR